MDDLCQDSQSGLPTEYFALCSKHSEASCFNRSVLIGTSVDFKRFEKCSVPLIRHEGERFIGHTDYPRNEGRLANRIFLEKHSLDVSLGPYQETSVSKISLPPKKMDFFLDWVGLFEICFQSSKMTDPQPCPTGWAYLEIYRVQRRHAKLKPTTNYQLQKSIFLNSQRNITGQNISSTNIYRMFLGKKMTCLHLP